MNDDKFRNHYPRQYDFSAFAGGLYLCFRNFRRIITKKGMGWYDIALCSLHRSYRDRLNCRNIRQYLRSVHINAVKSFRSYINII
ncbi:hypothetical protein D3C81_2014820 [compost metagenome]